MKLIKLASLSFLLMATVCWAETSPNSGAKGASNSAETSGLVLEVYKTPTCACCDDWIEHMEMAGFSANSHHPQDIDLLKQEKGITPELRSCHTAVYQDKYFFEGHVPAKYVEQFLANPPEGAIGLTVPGMPVGSPGMEMGDRFDPYQVILVMENGEVEVYEEVETMDAQY